MNFQTPPKLLTHQNIQETTQLIVVYFHNILYAYNLSETLHCVTVSVDGTYITHCL